MQIVILLAAVAASFHSWAAHAAPTAASPANPICQSSAPFASVDDLHPRLFNYNGTGASFFAGTNTWWASHLLSDDDLEQAFRQIKDTQLQVTRVWGFGSVNEDPGQYVVYFQLLNSTGSFINYEANGIPRLDAVVSYAEKIGIKLVLPFVNNW
jgi:mannan endo-1,4-beta-mannosidase